ncbi:hypothetical protein HK097_009104 [Rhizophlyctis rosea]|uniref:Uncharacterized protein n=1 Tax=Rhizophlyctis rosea TaxID=64517 RepID=A0AAD5SC58_9FUNG|nr:hypothetical protein HK097_009104 [Rhizophlyctis rosea]
MSITIPTEPYTSHQTHTFNLLTGRHITAHVHEDPNNPNDSYIVVYQAYSKGIADAVVNEQGFKDAARAAGWKESRMTWIKPGFLWMMYRSGWATKPSQTSILAIKVRLPFFLHMLQISLPARLSNASVEFKHQKPDIIIQWDPSHSPNGTVIQSLRAIQIGIRGGTETNRRFASGEEWVGVEDVTEFVESMKGVSGFREGESVRGGQRDDGEYEGLVVPVERLVVVSEELREIAGADSLPHDWECTVPFV